MRLLLVVLTLGLFLPSCRYTFWPLIPPEVPYPERFSVTGVLEEGNGLVRARLVVRRVDGPGYLLVRWYREEAPLMETALFIEAPGTYVLELPKKAPGFYRLLAIWQGEPVLQLDLGTPEVPPP